MPETTRSFFALTTCPCYRASICCVWESAAERFCGQHSTVRTWSTFRWLRLTAALYPRPCATVSLPWKELGILARSLKQCGNPAPAVRAATHLIRLMHRNHGAGLDQDYGDRRAMPGMRTRASHSVFSVREMTFGTREEFEYFMCGSCGCLQIATIPPDLARHYPGTYYSHNREPIRHPVGLFRNSLEYLQIRTALFERGFKLSRLASKFAPVPEIFFRARPQLLRRAGVRSFKSAILDIGCGAQAQWLRDLRAIGFRRLCGIDPMIDRHLNVDGIPIRRVDATTFAAQSSQVFDLITCIIPLNICQTKRNHSRQYAYSCLLQVFALSAFQSSLHMRGIFMG